ncbi:MAG: hypothetical protein WAV95_05705 [Azonexus sp.]
MKVQAWLPLGEVVVGMRLAEAVVDAAGQVLVPAGTEISESLLHGLQRREVAAIRVEREVTEDPAELELRRARLAAQLDLLFRQAGEGVGTRQLYQAVLDYQLGAGA